MYLLMSRKIRVKVLYFAYVREVAGTSNEEFMLTEPAYIADIFSKVTAAHPRIAQLNEVIKIALNRKIILQRRTVLNDGDEVALIPPVTGG